jgi:hypothetical protein
MRRETAWEEVLAAEQEEAEPLGPELIPAEEEPVPGRS